MYHNGGNWRKLDYTPVHLYWDKKKKQNTVQLNSLTNVRANVQLEAFSLVLVVCSRLLSQIGKHNWRLAGLHGNKLECLLGPAYAD